MIVFVRILTGLLFVSFSNIGISQWYGPLEHKVDSTVQAAIEAQSFPGCVIHVEHKGTVVFNKPYGFHTYDSARRVAVNDIYDLASVTKVAGATLALMKLYEEGLFSLDDPICLYIKGLGGRVGKATIRECLAHQAGLYPWIPYYQEIRKKNGRYKSKTVGPPGKGFHYLLTDSLYLHQDFYKKIKKMIKKSGVDKEKRYKYSGLFFYLVPEMVLNLSERPYEEYLNTTFYDSLRAETLGFNPLVQFKKSQIAPTENDTYFRMEQIHGTVHDEGAIAMKGVSGNAGLFGNASDLAKIWKMFMNDGVYDSVQYLKPSTLQLFTTAQYPNNDNRRALGFDKPLLAYDPMRSSIAKDASYLSYGHSGFTGTLVWADPRHELLFVFLANRVYPTRENRNIYNLNIRPAIHQLFYEHIKRGHD